MAVLSAFINNTPVVVIFIPVATALAQRADVPAARWMMGLSFAANCSFATPIGYQTNLLVMGPGHYRFADFLKVGAPLALLIWLAFSLLAPLIHGL